MRPFGRLLLLLAALVAAVPAVADDGDPPGRVGRVAQLSGTVRTQAADGSWSVLPLNRPMTTGDRVVTDSDGKATIQVGSSVFRLGADTDVEFERLDDDFVRLHFDHGRLALHVRSAAVLGEISVQTDEGRFVPHHAGQFRFDRAPGGTLAAMAWSGDLLLEAHDSSLPIAADERVEVWQEGPSQVTHYRRVAIPSDDFADWVLSQDKADDHAAAAAADAASAVPAEMTGAAELSQYGRWSTSADYGALWTPDDVPAGWAPYRNGSWNWIAPWGWTWIDASPWGFAPFHYGRWLWINGHWAWVPGSWGTRPVFAPALVGWLGGTGFTLEGAQAVGWVPLGWDEPFFPPYWCSPVYWGLVNGPVPPPARPPRKGVQPVRSRPLGGPSGPARYANGTAPGGVTIVPVARMTERPPPNRLQTPAMSRLAADAAAGAAHEVAEPAPPVGREPAGLDGWRSEGRARAPGAGGSPSAHARPSPGGTVPGARAGGPAAAAAPAVVAPAAPATPAAPAAPAAPAGPGGRGGGRSAALATPPGVKTLAQAQAQAQAQAESPSGSTAALGVDRLHRVVPAGSTAPAPVRISRVAPAAPEPPPPPALPPPVAGVHGAEGFVPAPAGLPAPGSGIAARSAGGMGARGVRP